MSGASKAIAVALCTVPYPSESCYGIHVLVGPKYKGLSQPPGITQGKYLTLSFYDIAVTS